MPDSKETNSWSFRQKEEWLESAKLELECMQTMVAILKARKEILLACMESEEITGTPVSYDETYLSKLLTEIASDMDEETRRELYRRVSVVCKKNAGRTVSPINDKELAQSVKHINARQSTHAEIAEAVTHINREYVQNPSWDFVGHRVRR